MIPISVRENFGMLFGGGSLIKNQNAQNKYPPIICSPQIFI